jgi:hypothetical protein
MTITNGDILEYILNNRLHVEDGEYLLQEKVETMGHDAIGSARAWLFGRFLHAGETEIFEAFITMTYDDLTPGDLTELSAIRAAFFTATGSNKQTTSIYMMLFESLIRLSVAYIWKAAGMEGEADSEEKNAQELISAIVGAYGNPENVLGDEDGGDMADAALESVVSTYNLTEDEVKEITGNYE